MIKTDNDSAWAGCLLTEPDHIADLENRFIHNPEVDIVIDADAGIQKITVGRFDGDRPGVLVHTDMGVFLLDTDLRRQESQLDHITDTY